MEDNKEKEVKDKIFVVFSESLTEPFRQQVYAGQLSGLIYKWCKECLKYDVSDMGIEIVNIAMRILKTESKARVPRDEESFFKYLSTALKTGKAEYNRNYASREKDDLIRMKESHLGRKLTEDEKVSSINKWCDYENAMKVTGTSLTGTKKDESPQADYLNSENTAIILEAINTVLSRTQERSRDCYRALLTLHCIDNVDLYPALDSRIIEACRQRTEKPGQEKPKQYEIYQKYHPGASKKGSEAMASKNLKEILSDLEAYLKEKNPEIFH